MSDTPSRMFGLVCVLILIWVGVYWLYEPRVRMPISPAPAAAMVTLDPRPAAVVVPREPEPTPAAPSQPEPVPPPRPKVVSPPVPTNRVVAPRFRQYVVQQGDVSFEAIAQRLFHDRKKWGLIARANPFATSDRLKPGKTVLNIPLDETNIQGIVVAPSGAPVSPADANSGGDTARETMYVVQEGDTLWAIAKKVYGKGNGAMWERIYAVNREVIKNKDRPPTGGVLKIPPKTE